MPMHMLGFIGMVLINFLDINMVNFCMWTAHLANINVGVISVIWSMTPLLQAIVDYFLFKEKLKYNLWIGMILMVFTSALLSMQSTILG